MKALITVYILFINAVFQLQAYPLVQPEVEISDVCIYGATPSGIAAAVAASKSGINVLLIEENEQIGGMMTSGMSNPDFKTFEAVSGFYRDFMQEVVNFYSLEYGEDSQQVKDCYKGVWYEPKVALAIFTDMLEENNVRVLTGHSIQDAVSNGTEGRSSLEAISVLNKRANQEIKVEAKVFIDATYEGDLMAMAGCKYNIGRESRQTYGELFAGVKYYDNKQFLIGSTGEGDNKIQCYNFRICMTDDPQNRIDIKKPAQYNRNEFVPLIKLFEEGKIDNFNQLVGINRIPNQKADFNDKMYSPVSLRLTGENYGWPDGDASTRQQIWDRHKSYSLAFFYFLQNDSSVPEQIQTEARQWGLPADEFLTTNHFPPLLYVREGRRLHAEFVLTEKDLLPYANSVRSPLYSDAIAICDYSMDSHGNAPPSSMHPNITEGVFNYYVVPYQIPYGVLVPDEIDRLLVSCAVSASHVAFSSLRMEPTWCALGQASGIAAAQSVLEKIMVRDVSVPKLQESIYEQNGMTVYVSDVQPESPYFKAVQFWGTKGFFHDLPEYKDVPYVGRGKSLGRGQYIEAYPYHELNPDKKLDFNLYQHWIKTSGLNPAEITEYESSLTRGEFLKSLYEKLQTQQ